LIDYEQTKLLIKGNLNIVLKENLTPFNDFFFVLEENLFEEL
jgi:hypothetical protein